MPFGRMCGGFPRVPQSGESKADHVFQNRRNVPSVDVDGDIVIIQTKALMYVSPQIYIFGESAQEGSLQHGDSVNSVLFEEGAPASLKGYGY